MKVHHIYALYVHVSNKNKNITKFTMFLRFTYWFQNLLLQMELEKEMKTVEQYWQRKKPHNLFLRLRKGAVLFRVKIK